MYTKHIYYERARFSKGKGMFLRTLRGLRATQFQIVNRKFKGPAVPASCGLLDR
jgi:hypothetical protein